LPACRAYRSSGVDCPRQLRWHSEGIFIAQLKGGIEKMGSRAKTGSPSPILSNLLFFGPLNNDIPISSTTVDDSVILYDGTLSRLTVAGSKIVGKMKIVDNFKWYPGILEIEDTSVSKTVFGRSVEKLCCVKLSGLDVADWWADDLETTTLLLNRTEFNSALFDRLAKLYRDKGQYDTAKQILYLKKNAEYYHSDWIVGTLLFAYWIFAGYGLRLGIVLVWYAAFIIAGCYIFRTGTLNTGSPPRSWFVFTIDAVLPVIKVDAQHDEIEFADWRQYYLYGMKFLSAVLVFLVLKALQESVLGGGGTP
jgi:hypothetical protein